LKRACRKVLLPVSIGGLLLFLAAAPAVNGADTGSAGVPVTKEVPHSKESIPEIKDRERSNPPPSRGDTAIPSHKVPRARKDDDCGRTE
jgi:hypothetical protein